MHSNKQVIIFSLFVISILFLFSCIPITTDQKIKEAFRDNESKNDTEQLTENKDYSYGEYTLEQLQNDVESALDRTTLVWKKEENTPLYSGNSQRSYLIYHLDEPIRDIKPFQNQFSASQWTGWKYFADQEKIKHLQSDLPKEVFNDEKKYREYLLYRSTIEQTISEQVYTLTDGKVLEYQFLNWIFNKDGYWKGSWVDTLVIYKIYCSPDFVVFLRPTGDKFTLGVAGSASRSDVVYTNWETEVRSIRKKMLVLSDKILESCPVENDFFNQLPNDAFKKSTTFYYYLPADLQFYWNLTTKISPEIVPVKRGDSPLQFLLGQINVTFTNEEPFDIEPELFLDITTISDGKEKNNLITGKKLEIGIKAGKTIFEEINSFNKAKFEESIEINITPNAFVEQGKTPVRPTSYKLFSNGTLAQLKFKK